MSTLFTSELIDGLLIIGTISAANIILCPLVVWALTVPITKAGSAQA